MGKFRFIGTELADLYIVEPQVFGDERGYFMETFNDEFAPYVRHIDGTPCTYVQDNESCSGFGVLRGLHMQWRHPQGKLVRVIEGEVFDVTVDVRLESPTFGRAVGEGHRREGHRARNPPQPKLIFKNRVHFSGGLP